jgi:hypothetical protein
MRRKTTFVLFLVFALILAWVVIITDEKVQGAPGQRALHHRVRNLRGACSSCWRATSWDQTLAKSLKSLHDTTDSVKIEDVPLIGR